MEKQVVAGLPAITPTEREMKESGAFREAQHDLMRVDQEAVSQQMSYLQEMASELKLTVLPLKDLANLKRETGYEWTNGWTHHKPTPVMKSQERERKRLEKYVRDQQEHKKMEWIRQAKKHVSSKKLKKIAIPIHGTGKFPTPKKRKKRQRLHVGRNGKKPRKLKGFVFGDDIWKVRKPRKRRKR